MEKVYFFALVDIFNQWLDSEWAKEKDQCLAQKSSRNMFIHLFCDFFAAGNDDDRKNICSSISKNNETTIAIEGYRASFVIKQELTIPQYMNISLQMCK